MNEHFIHIRVTKYFRNSTDLDLPVTEQNEGALVRRLNEKTTQLIRGLSWKDLQAVMEAEAVSKVAVRKLLHDLYTLAKGLSDNCGLHPDVGTVILLRMFLQEPVHSPTHKRLLEHVFGSVTAVLQHRLAMITHDIALALPDYTISFLKNFKVSTKAEMFGKQIEFVPLQRGKLPLLDVSHLQNVDIFIISDSEDVNKQVVVSKTPPSDKCLCADITPVSFQQIENHFFEEVRFLGTTTKCNKNTLVKVSSLDTIVQKVFNQHTLDDYESILFPDVYYSNENLLIPLLITANKITVILLAVMNMVKTFSDNVLSTSKQYKAVYLTQTTETAQMLASEVLERFAVLHLVTGLFVSSHHFNKEQLECSHVLFTTFSQWDAFTRLRGTESILKSIHLLIIDEVNTLEEDCGPLIETLVIRTKNQVKHLCCGRELRVVGLYMSCLYPPSMAIAHFLSADPSRVLKSAWFCMSQNIVLIRVKTEHALENGVVETILFDTVCDSLFNRFKVIVFVRNASEAESTALTFLNTAKQRDLINLFCQEVVTMENKNMMDKEILLYEYLLRDGILVLHSEMNSKDLNLMWRMFNSGKFQVAVASVNLVWEMKPQSCSIIVKETELYEDKCGNLTAVTRSVLSNMIAVSDQRMGFSSIISNDNTFYTIFDWLRDPHPVESCLMSNLEDILNVEIVLHNIVNMEEGVKWFKSTYLYHRMRVLTQMYLDDKINALLTGAINTLQKTGMVRLQESGNLTSTELGNIASCHNIGHQMINYIRKYTNCDSNLTTLVDIVLKSPQLITFQENNKQLLKGLHLKENHELGALLQAYFSHKNIENRQLQVVQYMFVKEFLAVFQAMFKLSLNKKNAVLASQCLELAKMCEHHHWKSPAADTVLFKIEHSVLPINKTLLMIWLLITPNFIWDYDMQSPEYYWLWLEDSNINIIYNYRYIPITRSHVEMKMCIDVSLHATVVESLPKNYVVHLSSSSRVGYTQRHTIFFQNLTFPCDDCIITDFLALQPLSVSALCNEDFQQLYLFHHWDPLMRQVYHCLYHSDHNVLLAGRILNSHKTIAAELTILRALQDNSHSKKVIYTVPAMSYVKKRLQYWQWRLPWKVAILEAGSADIIQTFENNNVLLCTRRDWELFTRNKHIHMCKVSVVILDDVEEIDAPTEVIVSRMTSDRSCKVRLIGLSSLLLANAADIAFFLNIPQTCSFGVYNFHHSSPTLASVPNTRVLGFSEKLYAPRMMAMNQSIWEVITKYCSHEHPAAVIVPSCRQVLLTIEALLQMLSNAQDSKMWLHTEEQSLPVVSDATLRMALCYGVGFYHIGISESDFRIVQQLFNSYKIQVVVLTISTVDSADFVHHLVLLKGTELYDDDMESYVDIPVHKINKILHSSHGSCSRCYEDACASVILTQDTKKDLYQCYLQGGFPVESSLLNYVAQYLNVEIVGGITSKSGAEEFLSHSFLALRLHSNPSYYVHKVTEKQRHNYISFLTEKVLNSLADVGCIEIKDIWDIKPTAVGKLSSKWNLSHQTLEMLNDNLHSNMTTKMLLVIVSQTQELRQLVVSVIEAEHIRKLEKCSKWSAEFPIPLSSSKVLLMLQYHFSNFKPKELKCYSSTLQKIAKTAFKILEVAILLCVSRGWLVSTLAAHLLQQMIATGSWAHGDYPLLTLPHVTASHLIVLRQQSTRSLMNLPEMYAVYNEDYRALLSAFGCHMRTQHIAELYQALKDLPMVNIGLIIYGQNFGSYEIKKFNQKLDSNLERKVQLISGKQYKLCVQIKVVNPFSWTLILGHIGNQQVLAFERIQKNKQRISFTFIAPVITGIPIYTLYLMSDVYIGLDQQLNMHFKTVNNGSNG